MVRQRPGISLDELRKALGPDVYRRLKRLELLRYIRRVGTKEGVVLYPVERPRETTASPRTLSIAVSSVTTHLHHSQSMH